MRSLLTEVILSFVFIAFIGAATILIYLADDKGAGHEEKDRTNIAFITSAAAFGALCLGSAVYLVYNEEHHRHPGRMFAHILTALTMMALIAVGVLCIVAAVGYHNDSATRNYEKSRDYLIGAAVLTLGTAIGYGLWTAYSVWKNYKYMKYAQDVNHPKMVMHTDDSHDMRMQSPRYQSQMSPQQSSQMFPQGMTAGQDMTSGQDMSPRQLSPQERRFVRRSVAQRYSPEWERQGNVYVEVNGERTEI